jgi:NAD(P)-dependent dehydrogenase (short-subunit alcohol dehydrogenase family)
MNAIITDGGREMGGACTATSGGRGERRVSRGHLAAAKSVAREINRAVEPQRWPSSPTSLWPAMPVVTWKRPRTPGVAIDAVVHAAGVAGPAAPLPEFDEAEFDQVMAVKAAARS